MINVIVDGRNMAFRTLVSGPLRTSTGERIEVPFIFLKMLSRVLREHTSTDKRIVVCWDGGVNAERRALHPGYKQRVHDEVTQAARVEIDRQVPILQEILRHLGVLQLSFVGVEADDIIATLAVYRGLERERVVIVSTDTDFFQLVSQNVSILRGANLLNLENFSDETGVLSPPGYLLAKALVGDTSDGIPGIRGVGWKTAAALVGDIHTLEGFQLRLANVTSSRADSVRKNWERVEANVRLMELPSPFLSQAVQGAVIMKQPPVIQPDRAMAFLHRYEMSSIIADRLNQLIPFGVPA